MGGGVPIVIVVMRVDSSREYWKVDRGVSAKSPNFVA